MAADPTLVEEMARMPSEIEKLVERLQAATGPDRELDAQIALLIGVVPEGAFRPCAALDIGTFATGAYSFWTCERYTELIDAARTLINEECWCWGVGFSTAGYSAHMEEPCLGFEIMAGQPGIATPAIALTIAALEAMKALQANVRPISSALRARQAPEVG